MNEILFIFAFNCFVRDLYAPPVMLIDVQKNNFLNVVVENVCFRAINNIIRPFYAERICTLGHKRNQT